MTVCYSSPTGCSKEIGKIRVLNLHPFAFGYGLVISILMCLHEAWLCTIHYRHLKETSQNPNVAFIDAIPTYLPFAVFILLFPVFLLNEKYNWWKGPTNHGWVGLKKNIFCSM